MKNEMRNNIQQKREDKMREINEEAKLLKLQKQYNEELAKYLKMEELSNNKMKYESIKGQQVFLEEKKKSLDVYYNNISKRRRIK